MKRVRIITAVLFALLALSGLSIVSAQFAGLDTTTSDRANLRSGPGTEFDLVGTLASGTTVRLDGRNQNGNWVRGLTTDRQSGWMSSGLVNVSLSQLNGLPIIAADADILVSPPSGTAAPAQTQNNATSNTETEVNNAPAAASSGGGGLGVTANSNVNIRVGDGTTYRRVGGLSANEQFNIDGRNGANTWVRGISSRGIIGWVSIQYLNISTQQVSSLPIVGADTPFRLTATGGRTTTQAAAPAQAAAPINNGAPVTGFAYGGHVASLDGGTVSAMQQAGMTWVKKQIRVGSGGEGAIGEAHRNGFRILLGVVGEPSSVNDDGYLDRYASFVAGLASAGADAIEIWNEPNLDREWSPPIDPARYTELLRRSYIAIKGANPNTLVISGAPAPTGAEGAFPGRVMNDDRFIAGMAAAGAANYMDCVGAHYNEGIVPPSAISGDPRSDYYTRYFPSMVNLYAGTFGLPVCFTELGYLTPEGYGQLPDFFAWAANVTVAQQAAWLDEVVSIARGSGRVRLVIIWNVDFENYGADPMAGYAIIRPGGDCPACRALGN